MKKLIPLLLFTFLFVSCKPDVKSVKKEVGLKTETSQKDKKYEEGRSLFLINCASCHSTQMNKIMTAPALGGVTKRREKKWLYDYTRNSMEMFKNGDSIAVELRNQGWALMTSFPDLTDEKLDIIYYFVEKKFEIGDEIRVMD
ncbi:cytochrome c [Maribacter algarum]|uniref:Cytochrome c n=2 Tax=Maribacter algarum (ex Zhang et al. 2020) TaxID=2578118 RepID=A0A5S3PBG6_9FLAO|nr:cytochrome c [Maribacter algarum]